MLENLPKKLLFHWRSDLTFFELEKYSWIWRYTNILKAKSINK